MTEPKIDKYVLMKKDVYDRANSAKETQTQLIKTNEVKQLSHCDKQGLTEDNDCAIKRPPPGQPVGDNSKTNIARQTQQGHQQVTGSDWADEWQRVFV